MGYPGKVKFPIISNHFTKRDRKGELSAVFSSIFYLNMSFLQCLVNLFFSGVLGLCYGNSWSEGGRLTQP